MTVQVVLEVHEVNTVLEGLARVQDNAARIQNLVRNQVGQQLQAAAEPVVQAAEQKAAEPASPGA
jgi:hypothetical protein